MTSDVTPFIGPSRLVGIVRSNKPAGDGFGPGRFQWDQDLRVHAAVAWIIVGNPVFGALRVPNLLDKPYQSRSCDEGEQGKTGITRGLAGKFLRRVQESGKFNLRIPPELHENLAMTAEVQGKSSTGSLRKHSRDASGHRGTDNKPLEWTGHLRFPACALESLPATQGQRSLVCRPQPR
jgi:hypothetical protein